MEFAPAKFVNLLHNLKHQAFLPIDLYRSHATKFLLEEEGLRPPINSISGMGTVAAEGLYNAAQEKPFNSVEDVKKRAKIGNATIDSLRKFGCFKGIPESDQMSLFDVI